MGLLETEVQELRNVIKRIDNKSITDSEMLSKMVVYSQITQRVKLILQSYALGARYGKTTLNRIMKSGLIGDGSCIDDSCLELEMIKCQLQDVNITRRNCLEYSGSSDNMDKCSSCDNFNITRRYLLAEVK